MDYQKFLKYCLNEEVLTLVLVIVAFSVCIKAEKTLAPQFEIKEMPLIMDVTYSYELFSDSQMKLDCVGTLSLSLSLPSDVSISHLIFERTKPKMIDPDLSRLFFSVKSEYPATAATITETEFYWGTYFRIRAILSDGNDIYSPVYSVNDYIDQKDLESILNQSSVKDIDTDNISLYIEGKNLHIATSEPLTLDIFDLQGNHIYAGNVQTSNVILLDQVNTPFIIARYKTSNIIKTKKILVP